MIGIVGAGTIVTAAHLPAYRKLGLPVAAIYDVDRQKAARLAEEWNARPAATLESLLDDPQVQIVDIAVPPAEQGPIAEAAFRSGKHVLAQKPLARTLTEATRLVELAEGANRLLVVNQQMRWSPMLMAIRTAVDDERLGALEWLEIDTNLPIGPGHETHWLAQEPRLIVLMNTIHFLDAAGFLLGRPSSLVATFRWSDRYLHLGGETGAVIGLDFPGGAQAWILDRFNGLGILHATLQVSGTNGSMRGRFGLWTNYPLGEDDEIEYRAAGSNGWERVPVTGRWIPDAFSGPMSELVAAIRGGPAPTTSGRHHLETLAMVEAVYEAAASGCRVRL
jgi:predicted dehydrogenase